MNLKMHSSLTRRLLDHQRFLIALYCGYHQDESDQLFPGAEFAYNPATSENLVITPF